MLILAIADIHGSSGSFSALAGIASRVDLVLIAGDLTDFGGAREARAILAEIEAVNGRIAAVGGNCDRKGVRDLLIAEGRSADGRLVEAGGARVIGAGGSQLRSGMTPYERRDGELAEALVRASGDAALREGAGLPLIALTHAPPKDSGADARKGVGVGSPALREVLDRLAPVLWVCGHIHESPCAAYSGRTLVLNPGSLRDGRYALSRLDLGEDGAWRASAELFAIE
jgi:uncharacterized protein